MTRFVCIERVKVGDQDGEQGVLERSVLPCVRPDQGIVDHVSYRRHDRVGGPLLQSSEIVGCDNRGKVRYRVRNTDYVGKVNTRLDQRCIKFSRYM